MNTQVIKANEPLLIKHCFTN